MHSDESVASNIVEIIPMSKPDRDARKKMDNSEKEDTQANIAPGITESHEPWISFFKIIFRRAGGAIKNIVKGFISKLFVYKLNTRPDTTLGGIDVFYDV